MNREQRRKMLHDAAKRDGKLAGSLKEGDKVKLNIKAMCMHPNWSRLTNKYKEWVFANASETFTVEYDEKHLVKPTLVCLSEDQTEPKWLSYVGDLKKA